MNSWDLINRENTTEFEVVFTAICMKRRISNPHIYEKVRKKSRKVFYWCTKGRNIQLVQQFSDSEPLEAWHCQGIVLHDTLIFRDHGS